MVQDYCLSFGRKCPFSKGMLHLLKDASIICRGIACWKKHLIFSKETCKSMTKASLQGGEASLLYLILHLEQEFNVLNSCYIPVLQKHISPAKEGCTSFEGNPAFLRKTRDILQGIAERFIDATMSMVLRCKYISIYFFLNCVYLKWSFTITFWLWCIYYIAFNKGDTIHKVTLKQWGLHGTRLHPRAPQ